MIRKNIGIMIVEDDEVDIENIKRVFKKHSVTNKIFYASDGQDALNQLRGEQGAEKAVPMPSVILLDINMPKMNGLEFLQEIRKDPNLQHLPVFIFTTSNNEQDKMEAYRLNVAGYILKPMQFSAFAEALSTLDAYWSLIEPPEKY